MYLRRNQFCIVLQNTLIACMPVSRTLPSTTSTTRVCLMTQFLAHLQAKYVLMDLVFGAFTDDGEVRVFSTLQ